MKSLFFCLTLSLLFINAISIGSEEFEKEMQSKVRKEIEFAEGGSIVVEGNKNLVQSIKKEKKGIEVTYQNKSLKIGTDFRLRLKDLVIEESNRAKESILQDRWGCTKRYSKIDNLPSKVIA